MPASLPQPDPLRLDVPGAGVLLVGDLTWPLAAPPRLDTAGADLGGAGPLPNLEGPVLDPAAGAPLRGHAAGGIWNHPSVLGFLRDAGARAVGLANNHVTDFEGGEESTLAALAAAGLHPAGFGRTPADAARPLRVQAAGGAAWQLVFCGDDRVGCRAPGALPGTHLFAPDAAAAQVRSLAAADPAAPVAAVVHWGYELQPLPSPEQRRVARALLDAGARLVVGHHAHVAQGFERAGEGLVLYSLGNFLMWEGPYAGFHVRYPAAARRGAGVLLDGGPPRVVALAADPSAGLVRVAAGPAAPEESFLAGLSPFAGLDEAAYAALHRARSTVSWWYPTWTGREGPLRRRLKRARLAAVQRLKRALARRGGPRPRAGARG